VGQVFENGILARLPKSPHCEDPVSELQGQSWWQPALNSMLGSGILIRHYLALLVSAGLKHPERVYSVNTKILWLGSVKPPSNLPLHKHCKRSSKDTDQSLPKHNNASKHFSDTNLSAASVFLPAKCRQNHLDGVAHNQKYYSLWPSWNRLRILSQLLILVYVNIYSPVRRKKNTTLTRWREENLTGREYSVAYSPKQ
jgi:hypothetical protein